MNFRITTNMMMNSYQYNLMQSTNTLNSSRTKVETHRNFNSYAEDPAAATHAWRLRRALMKNDDYQTSNTEAYTRFQIAYSTLGEIDNKLLNEDAGAKAAIKRADNDPTGGARTNLGTVLSQLADSLIFNMNSAKYGDHFVFSGNDEMNVPFSWGESGELLYRGVNVNAGAVEVPEPSWATEDGAQMVPVDMPDLSDPADYAAATQAEQDWYDYYTGAATTEPTSDKPEWGEEVPVGPDDPTEADQEWLDYYRAAARGEEAERPTAVAGEPAWALPPAETDQYGVPKSIPEGADPAWVAYYKDQGDLKHLNAMADESVIMDLGMGMKEEGERELIDASAFNRTIPGIEVLGYGVDEDGDPKNIAILMKRLAKLYSQCNDEGHFCDENGEKSDEVEEEVYRLLNKFNVAHDEYNRTYADVSARSEFLKANGSSLEEQGYSLQEQIVDIENVNMAGAISQFMWDYTCYNAALKVGTQILSQSLIDYMS